MAGDHPYTGGTTVNAGALHVVQPLASAVTVNTGGALQGTSLVRGITAAGGTVSPGTGLGLPGILASLGDVSFNAASNLDIDLNGTDGRISGPDPERQSYGSYAEFRDPDGNKLNAFVMG